MGALIADEYPRAATEGRLSRVAMLAVEGRRTICTAKDGRQFETEILCRKNLTERAAFQMVSERDCHGRGTRFGSSRSCV